jgi:plasmid maintenance system antidote protein VapI
MSKAKPDHSPVSLGEIIAAEYLEPLGMSAYRLAKSLHVPVGRIPAFIKEEIGSAIDAEVVPFEAA